MTDRKYTAVVCVEFDAEDDKEAIGITRSLIGVGLRTTDRDHRPVRYPWIKSLANLTGVKTVAHDEVYVLDLSQEPVFVASSPSGESSK